MRTFEKKNPLLVVGLPALIFLAVAAVLPALSTVSSKLTDYPTQRLNYLPGEVLVRFRKDSPAKKSRRLELSLPESGRQIPLQLDDLGNDSFVEGLRLARVDPVDTLAAISALRVRPDVLYAEPNYLRRKSLAPNDARYFEQWSLKNTGQSGGVSGIDIKAEQAWDITTGNRSIVVGIVDEGIDINHPDLRDNIWRNPGETPGNGVDDDNNGFVDDINGWDFVHDDNTVFDATGSYPADETDAHGTHVAGIVGAAGNNSVGVTGVNWQVSLMSLKFLGPTSGTTADLLRALAYAKMMRDLWSASGGLRGANIRVLNNSYGGRNQSQAEFDAIIALAQSNILFVAAAGNESSNNDLEPEYPASYKAPNVISVASFNRFQGISPFTNTGPLSVHLFAPGEDILSTTPGGTYDYFDGTSMASPHVAGVAALLCAHVSSLTLDRLRSAILYSGDVYATSPFFTITSRRLNAFSALQTVSENDTIPPGALRNFRIPTGVNFDPREVRLEWTAPGDDDLTGRAAFYDIRFSDNPINSSVEFEQARPFSSILPEAANTPQSQNVKIPYRHASGYFAVRAVDNAGNAGPISSSSVSVNLAIADPYTVSTAASSPLSTGGTPLGLVGDDEYYRNYHLPFVLSSFNSGQGLVSISTNGALYFTSYPPTHDSQSSSNKLQYYYMIAGLWDDLRTDRRAGDDVYVVQPDPSRIIFRWQAVTFDTPIGPGVTRGENPVSFEIELRRDGTVLIRYGDGNHNTFPVVGVSGGSPDAYVVSTHTSESVLKDLNRADTIIFASRNPPQPPASDMQIRSITDTPDPVGSGQNITYMIEALNLGPDLAQQPRITFALPPGTSFVSCGSTEGICAGPAVGTNGTVIVDQPYLDPIHSWYLTVVARIDAPPETVLTATATGSSFWSDPVTSNNSQSTTTLVAEYRIFNNVTRIAGGAAHSIIAKADGSVWAWGSNEDGQLGDGSQSFSDFARLTPVQTLNIADARDVAGASTHSLVLANDGTVWSFGQNFRGQLGDGTIFLRPTPVKVTGLTNVKAIGAGHWLSVAVKTDGTVWTWGSNDAGDLGLGSFDQNQHPTPSQVPGLTGIDKVDAGGTNPGSHVVALRNDGTVWAWGRNLDGELGSGVTDDRATPAMVPGLSNVIGIAAGSKHSVAVRSDGTVWCWGDNESGQLGDGTRADRYSPVQLAITGIVSVAAGNAHTIALRNDGTVWSWGSNGVGQLGDGSVTERLTPVQVSGLAGVTAIAAGYGHNLALMPDGTVRTWGANLYGALGDGSSNVRSTPVQVTGLTRVITPTMFPDSLQFPFPSTVQVGCLTAGATIRYTTNGSEPSVNDPAVSGATILIQRSMVLKVKAWKTGYVPSETKTGNFVVVQPANPIDDSRTFIRQHYLDFLTREPDQGGWDYWTSQLTACSFDAVCLHQRRLEVSAAFFIELEFQETGYVVYRMHRAAFGTLASGPTRANLFFPQFIADRAQLVAGPGLPQSTVNFANAFVQRQAFLQVYPNTLTNAQFVNQLFDTAGLTPFTTERQQQIDAMNNNGKTRAQVLLDVIEIPAFKTREYNGAFVLMQYFGYLRRDPDQGGYDFWLDVLNNRVPGNFRGMVCAFLTSAEYQHRFGTTVTRTDHDCGP
ncbi:MAG TPA: S8 family serine peptidase [Pyrinomonadaceae bacterium]|nr:S8 family serine peptidase [Pyrinomonadaceae bacterium]